MKEDEVMSENKAVRDVVNLLKVLSSVNDDELQQLLNTTEQQTNKPEKRSTKSKGKAKRPLSLEEYEKLIELITEGFLYEENGKKRKFRPNIQVAMALTLQGNLGLRIKDVLLLKVMHFQRANLEMHEKKTNKLQYRKLNDNLRELVMDYALERELKKQDYLINLTTRNIQIAVKKAADHLGLENIGSHSFRKFFAMHIYKEYNGDIELVKSLLNHSDIGITQKYLKLNQEEIDEASAGVDFTHVMKKKLENN